MRYIALFLLLANVLYFIWAQTREDSDFANTGSSRALLNTGITLVSETDSVGPILCYRVSGFASAAEADGLIAEARAMGLQAALGANDNRDPIPPQFRVYLPPASSRAIATITLDGLGERLSELDSQIDSYLITRGPQENGIALGLFASEAEAQIVRQTVSELGYNPVVEALSAESEDSEGEVTVWLKGTDSDPFSAAQWADLTAERPALARSENVCETIAQEFQFP